MLVSFSAIIIASYATKYIFESRLLPKNFDIFQCVVNIPDEMIVLKEPTEGARLTNGAPPGAVVAPGTGGGLGQQTPVPAGMVKHNAPGAGINPSLKINREDLLLMPPHADYERLVESRTPSPLPEHSDRLVGAGERAAAPPSPDQPPAIDSSEDSSEADDERTKGQGQGGRAAKVMMESETAATGKSEKDKEGEARRKSSVTSGHSAAGSSSGGADHGQSQQHRRSSSTKKQQP